MLSRKLPTKIVLYSLLTLILAFVFGNLVAGRQLWKLWELWELVGIYLSINLRFKLYLFINTTTE